MPLAPYVLSLCLHVLIILIIWFWPAGKPLINLEQPVMISLVDGAPGGNKTPSPILGPMGAKAEGEPAPAPFDRREVLFAGEREYIGTGVYHRGDFRPGMRLSGPAIIEQMDTTIVIPPRWTARVDSFLNLMVEYDEVNK